MSNEPDPLMSIGVFSRSSLVSIKALRELDVPLRDIAEVVSARDPGREHYVVSLNPESGELFPPDEFRTEICWPVINDPATHLDA